MVPGSNIPCSTERSAEKSHESEDEMKSNLELNFLSRDAQSNDDGTHAFGNVVTTDYGIRLQTTTVA